MSIVLPPHQPRHVYKSEQLTAEEDLLLVELPSEEDMTALTNAGCVSKQWSSMLLTP